MSWYIKAIGPRAAVKAAVIASAVPFGLKNSIVEILDQNPDEGRKPHDSARVEGNGHLGGSHGCISKLEVELFTAAVLPEPVAPATDRTATEVGSAFGFEAKVNTDPASVGPS